MANPSSNESSSGPNTTVSYIDNQILEFIKIIKLATAAGVMGTSIRINEQGDSEGSYTILAAKFGNTSKPITSSRLNSFHCHYEMVPVGRFEYNNSSSNRPELNLTGNISWVLGKVPNDEPSCGYRGEKCSKAVSYDRQGGASISVGILGSLLLMAVLAALFFYHHCNVEQEIHGLAWKINPNDLVFPTKIKVRSIRLFKA